MEGILKSNSSHELQSETIVIGGGCFWCVEIMYQDLKGVYSVESGYAGGKINNPSYREVCSGSTGHAEVVKISFDSEVISLEQILQIFFTVHDPTTLNRQGNDRGTQYRSVIFYNSEVQKQIAEETKSWASDLWSDPIVTEISPLTNYFSAEKYHQNYFKDNPNQPYCSVIIAPKVLKFRKQFKELLRENAT
ncbi:MAG: peptide-methionine (S)-S-oxide reductase MsrA [Saprospiraceae bacterium]|nr:peptide-methionine (S)-S-oxide reductase MsrA [Saprospiraceae bacterium]MCB9342416.1 peptide-methionine (S)-S-oxide reductase MsrA [Lewinellaceae bacterium]